MALSTVSDLQTELLVRNNRTTTDSFITDQMLQDWTRMSHTWAMALHKWSFTEVRDKTVAFSVEEVPYSDFSVNFKADSIRFLQVGTKRLKKLHIRDYLTFREESASSSERVFSDFGRVLFINPNIDVSGTITAWGQYQPSIDPTDLTATTLFSTFDEEGNEAMVEKMTAYLKRREHQPDEAELHDQRAVQKLDEVWQRYLGEQHAYQTHLDSGGMFERIDVVSGELEDERFRRDQF